MDELNWEKAAKIFAPEKENWDKKIKKGIEKYPLTKDLLMILAAGGFVSLAIVAPGLAAFVAKEIKWGERAKLNQRLERLKKRKLINILYKNGQTIVEITEDGRKKALEYKFEEMKVKHSSKWDGRWRLVIFDVANDKRRQRDRLRDKLKSLGFLILNESVLIYPYDCLDEIEFIRQVFNLGKEVTYLTADRFEGDGYYENWFFSQE